MAYKLTPYDRRVQAELIRQEREARYASRYPTYRKTGAAAVAPVQDEKKNDNAFLRVLQTGLDFNANVAGGVLQSVEGLMDLVATGVGAIGGIFSDDFQDGVKDFIATDYTDKLFMQNMDKLTEGSYLNEGKAGEIIEGVAQGVGQMLPDVLISVATMGAYSGVAGAKAAATAGTVAAKQAAKAAAKTAAKQAAIKAGQRAAMVSLAAHATGSGIQEAFADGADYGEGVAYGALTGATEVATEKLTGGFGKLYGGGVLKGGAKQVAKTGAKRVLSEMAGEGMEEVISEATNPLRKTIYKGKDALAEYGDEEFWGGVAEAGAVGALTSAAYGGSVGRINKTSGVYGDARSVTEHIGEQTKKSQELKRKGTLTNEQAAQLERNVKADYELLSKRLQRASDKTRKRVLENPQFARAFESDGTLKADFAASLDRNIAAAGDTTYRLGYRSTNLDAETITKVLEKNSKDGQTVTAFDGELDEAGKKGLTVFQESMDAIGELNGGKTRYVVVQGLDGNASFDPDSGVIAINADQFSNGEGALVAVKSAVQSELWQGALVHETAHSTEGTASHAVLADHLISDDTVYGQAVSDFIERGYFGVDADAATDKLTALLEKSKNGDTLTEQEKSDLDTAVTEIVAIATENVLGNAAFIKRLVKGKPSVAEKILNKIVQIKDAVAGKRTAEQKKAEAFLNRAEQLYLNAIKESGFAYRDGKIVTADDEDEDEAQKEKDAAEGEVKWSLVGKWPDGRKVYRSDYAKGTQKSIKQAALIDLVQRVWSNKPIELHIGANETITAKFNPDLAERSDLAKMAYGNKKGTASDKRITLNLSGDFYAIAQDARYVGMRSEKGKENPTHNDVSEWRYFVTDLVYEEDDGSHIACYMQIDVKRNDNGDWFYSFGIEKGTAPQTLLAVVTDNAATVPNNSISETEPNVKRKIRESRKVQYSMAGKKTPTREELLAKTPIKIVDVKQGIASGRYTDMKSAVLEKATNERWFDAPHHNDDTDSLIFLTEKSFTHAYSNLSANFGEDTIRCMAHIPEIIKEAVLVNVADPKDSRKMESKVYTFFGAVDGVNGVEPVKLTVKEYGFRTIRDVPKNIRAYFEKNGIMDSYNSLYDAHALEVIGIEDIKKESDASGKVGAQGARARATSDSTISIADLLDLVKGDAEKYIPKFSRSVKGNEPIVNRKIQESRKVKYSMAGKKARTADKMKLATAQQMLSDGADSETVRRETGWFQGYDGEWRFEIDDSQMEFSREGYGTNEREKLMREERKLLIEIMDNKIDNPDKDISELHARRKALLEKFENTPAVTLPFYVKHDALFEAYPELRQVKVVLKPRDFSGGYSIKNNEIRIDSRFSDEEIKSALLHEMQHVVQQIEGFSGGANTTYWADRMGEADPEAYDRAIDRLNSAYKRLVERSSDAFLAKVKAFWRLAPKNKTQKYSPEAKALFDELMEHDEGDRFYDYVYALQMKQQLDERFGENNPYDMYLRTAGEVEANDTMHRMNLTAEQRKDIRPDIDRPNVLFADKESVFFGKNTTDFDKIILPDDVKYLGSRVRYSKRAKYIPYAKIGAANITFLRDELRKLYGDVGDGIADGIAIAKDSTVYIVDSGRDNGEIRFGVRTKIKFSDNDLRAEYVRRTNDEAVSNGYISDGLFASFKDRYDNDRSSNLRRESGTELPTDQRKPQNYERGVSNGNADRGGIKQSHKFNGELARENGEKTQVSEENGGEGVDENGEVRYNDSKIQFARKPVTPKKRIDRLINSTFPTEDKSGSEANRLAIWWVHKKYVETGDRALISYHGRWYLIQKFDSMDLGYLIMKRVKVAEYEWYKKEIERDGERNDTRIEILDEIAERSGAGDFDDGTKSSSNSDVSGHGQQDSDVLRLAAEQGGQKSEFDGQSGADHARSGTDQQGGEAELKLSRKSANRNHDKVYTKSDARKVLSDVLREQLVFGNEQAYGALYGKHYTEVVDKLWHVLNDAAPGERGGVALDMADYIIDNAAVESMDFSESTEALERVQILREYLHKLDLSGVSKHLADKYGKQWRAKKGTDGVSLEKVAAELRAKGVEIKGEGIDDLFLGIRDAYNEARSLTVNELKTKLGEVMPPEEREQRRQDIAKEILRGFDNVGEDSKLARETVRMEAERDALKKNYQERIEAEREQAKAEKEAMRESLAKKEERFQEMRRAFREERRKLRERFERWQAREEQLDQMNKSAEKFNDIEKERFFSASVYPGGSAILKKIPRLLRAALKTKRTFTGSIRNTLLEVKNWYCAEDNAMLFRATSDNSIDKMESGQVLFDKYIAAMLEELTSAKGELTVRELEMVNAVAQHFLKLSERYQRVFINGKWVDAEQMAEEMVKVMQTAKKDQNWIVRGLLNKYMRQFGDPAALFRAMDAYDPNGFYTKMHEWMRSAAISMQSDELHALREYYEWHEKHKKWTKHLENDMVEFRGVKMTVGQLMTLYCNTKTEKSKQSLADNGYKFVDKDGTPHRIKGIIYEQAPDTNKSVKHEREDVQRACKNTENAIWNMLTEEQREYVKLLENVLNTTCRKWKIDTDTLMKGFSLVHEDGYYFVTVPSGVAKTVDTTFYEGDRVGHLSFNHEVVEGARGELLIENIDDVVLRHVHNMSLYKNYAIVAENRSMLQNIDVGEVDATGKRVKNVHQAVTIRTVNEEFGKNRGTDLMKLLDKMSNDLQGGRRAGQDEQSFLKDLVEQIRGNYARFQLGLNPKTLATQLSSLIAAGNILEYNCIVRGVKGFGSKKTAQLVDKYCPLAELRNFDNSAALAAGVLETTGKVGDVLMKGIGFVDRRVICSLFYACQLQVQKDSKLELGTEENLKAAGELLTRVILETQQNSLVTEKSDAMRGGIFSRTFTMYTADGMKVIGRWFDSIGEWAVLSKRYKDAKTDADKARLKKELKRAHGQAIRSTSALAAQAVYMALISYLFRLLYDKDEEDAKGNILNAVWDFIGGIVGGLPLLRDMVSYFTEGYELDNFFLSTVNDVLVATGNAAGVAKDAISGKDVSRQDVAGAVRKVVYSAGQVFGIPVRNGYNFVTGLTRRIVPTAGYQVDNFFAQKAYTSDLERAIEAGDENMIETIAGLMIDEKIGIEDAATRKTLQNLAGKGYKVLPRSIGDSVTVDGEKIPLTGAQQKKLREVYAIGQDAVADMVKLKQFGEADDEVKEKAIKFIYDVYWDLALEDALGLDLAEKNVLFAEAIDIEKLAIIIATARAIEADKDKDGKAIAGTKKRKLQTFVNSLRLSAAEKYMVMGYLGYTNVNGEQQVMAHINKLNLNQYEKIALREYCGYSLSSKEREKMYTYTQKDKYAPYGGQDPNDPDRIAPK